MKNFKSFISEAKKCPEGKYYCYTDKKCKKIPTGYKVGYGGYLIDLIQRKNVEWKEW